MSKKVRVKQTKIGGVDASNINGLFEEMVGMKDADPEIIRPKFVKVMNIMRHIYNVFNILVEFKKVQEDFPNLIKPINEIKSYIYKMKDSIMFDPSKDVSEDRYVSLSKESINELYKKLKENIYTKQLICLCSVIRQHKVCLEDKNNLRDSFIMQEPGLSFMIFDFSTFDLKQIWSNSKTTQIFKNLILGILHNIYISTMELYEVITSPDIDIDEFINLLLSSIGQLKKTPALNRCNHAFKRIEDSVGMLKDNFSKYYRESVSCGNPDIIMQNFVIDVSNKGGPDAKLTSEFRKIIAYMYKLGNENGRNKDPKVKKLFQILNKNFEIMEKNTPKARPTTLDDFDLSEQDKEVTEQDKEVTEQDKEVTGEAIDSNTQTNTKDPSTELNDLTLDELLNLDCMDDQQEQDNEVTEQDNEVTEQDNEVTEQDQQEEVCYFQK